METHPLFFPVLALIIIFFAFRFLFERAKIREENIAKSELFEKRTKDRIEKLISTTEQSCPWLAKELSDIEYLSDMEIARELQWKRRPAKKAAEEVKLKSEEKRELKRQLKEYEYQLDFLRRMHPWLPDYEPVSRQKALSEKFPNDADNELRKWISSVEYNNLSPAKRNQLALDRWYSKKKEPWDAGRDYERYVGYLYETQGYHVEYEGALRGKEDRGIDIIASKDNVVEIIQCKRYNASASKYVRENTIAQLYGVATVYWLEHQSKKVIPVIYTSSILSNEAKRFANYLNIVIRDNIPLPKKYPIIKCNISQNGEKIYHLPFDQQYDKLKMTGKKGSMYVSTVAEAEQLGYRRAYKWRGNNEHN